MPTHLVNLDALLEREDFESSREVSVGSSADPLFKLEELASDRLFFGVLRKPHFQRETNNWSSERISQFVKSFLDNDLIPAIIIWHSKNTNKIFVIDGAHRVSSLLAWVNDDYGDGDISRKAFNYGILPAQRKFHNETKKLIESEIGSFKELNDIAFKRATSADETKLRRAAAIASRTLSIQRVDGDASVAEASFYRINGNAVPIDETELNLLHASKKPNTLAARAFVRAGRGHKYWGKLHRASEIEKAATEVYELVFGQILEINATSPDIPRAGQPYSNDAFNMALDIVNIFNSVTPGMWQRPKKSRSPVKQLEDDVTGDSTVEFLRKVQQIARLSNCNDYSGSFGLDHAVYCYGSTGKFHPPALLASFKFAEEIHRDKRRDKFKEVRAEFEDFLVRHKKFINDLGHAKGSRTRSVDSILLMLRLVLNAFIDGKREDNEIVDILIQHESLKSLDKPGNEEEESASNRRRFSRTAQSIALVKEILEHRPRCTICGARYPPSARSKDHTKPITDGGVGVADNLRWTHPACNSSRGEGVDTIE